MLKLYMFRAVGLELTRLLRVGVPYSILQFDRCPQKNMSGTFLGLPQKSTWKDEL